MNSTHIVKILTNPSKCFLGKKKVFLFLYKLILKGEPEQK